MSIRLKLTIMFLAIATLPLLLVAALTFHNYKDSLEANRLAQLQDLAIYRADKIETYFAGLKANIEVAQGYYNIKTNLPLLTRLAGDSNKPEFLAAEKMLNEQLGQMQSVLSGLSDIMLVNPQGKVVYANKPGHYSKDMSNGVDAEQKAFSEGKDRVYYSDVYFDKEEDNRFEMLVTAPASDFNGAFIGVIAFEVDMTPVYKLIQDTTGLGDTGEVLIGKKTGNQVLYLNPLRHDPNAALKRRIEIGGDIGRPMQEAVQGKTGVGQYFDYRGKKVIAAWRYIPSLGWGLVAKIDTDEAFADVTNLRNLAAIILVIVIVLSSITAFSIAQSISEPIKQLSEGAAIIGSGNLDYKIGTNLKDEIGQLSRSFDKMTLDLKQTTASRDELNREITERKRAEEAVRKSRDELEIRVKERTKELTVEVAERKKAEETVKAERKRFENVLEMMPAYAVLLTPDYHVAYANRTFRDWFGDDNGKKCYEFLFNRKEPCENCQTYNVMKTGKSQFWEWTGPNGQNYDIYDYPFTDTDGSPLIMEIGVDVTAHKQAQTALRSASLYARGLIEASLDPLVTISQEGKITDVNEATIKVTGVAREHLIGTDFLNYFTEPEKAREGYQQVFADGFVTDYPLTIRHRNGQLIDVLYNAAIYKNEAGEVQGVFAAARDVTEKKAAEAELEKYRLHLEDLVKNRTEELSRSNRDLEQFAYVASHDLQEPLRAVAGFVELIKRSLQDSLDDKTKEYINFSVDGAKRMQALISGLLEYSRIGTQGNKPKKTSSKDALDEAISRLAASIKETGAEITADVLPIVHFDDVQLSQLFQNLIGNAIKFRSEQAPRIRINAVRQDSGWQFAVTDNGIGIESQYTERIFQIFQRLHSREKYPGTGIGLSICKKIVERHNGKIWVESKPGNGSTFYFTVPIKEV